MGLTAAKNTSRSLFSFFLFLLFCLVMDYREIKSSTQCRGGHQHEGSCYCHDLAATSQQHPERLGTSGRQGKPCYVGIEIVLTSLHAFLVELVMRFV